jgi:hypothetical protein
MSPITEKIVLILKPNYEKIFFNEIILDINLFLKFVLDIFDIELKLYYSRRQYADTKIYCGDFLPNLSSEHICSAYCFRN